MSLKAIHECITVILNLWVGVCVEDLKGTVHQKLNDKTSTKYGYDLCIIFKDFWMNKIAFCEEQTETANFICMFKYGIWCQRCHQFSYVLKKNHAKF